MLCKDKSLSQNVGDFRKPFVFFHTHCVTKEILEQAIEEEKSIDLDVCMDDAGKPYLGHSKEYYEKSDEPWDKTMLLGEAVEMIAQSRIPAIVDCKHFQAWPHVEEVVAKIGHERCLVHAFVSEFKFDYNRREGDPDFLSEWLPIERLRLLKSKFPFVSTMASAKWLPNDLSVSDRYEELLWNIRRVLSNNQVDDIGLNIPDERTSTALLKYFLKEDIIVHVGVDVIDTSKLSVLYIGETDNLKLASNSSYLFH